MNRMLSITRKSVVVLVTIIGLLGIAPVVFADIYVETQGDEDPAANGWGQPPAAPGVTFGVGSSDLTASQCPYPCAYRSIEDRGTGSGNLGSYWKDISIIQFDDPKGWALRARVRRMPITEGNADGVTWAAGMYLRYARVTNQTWTYGVQLGLTADGKMLLNPVGDGPVIELGPSKSYHLVEIVSNPATDQIDLLVDGAVVRSNFSGTLSTTFTERRVRFGSMASGGIGITRWNMVQVVTDPDTDGDGISDFDEVTTHSTDPYDSDSDGDGLGDGFETTYGFDPLVPGEESLDGDGDGLDNRDEFAAGSDPNDADSDDDGLNDGDEVNLYGSNPLETESDGDGIDDFTEVTVYNTNPGKSDTDDDGLNDFDELNTYNTDPLNDDSDDDGLSDGQEVFSILTDPLNNDTDGDTLTDAFESINGFDPTVFGEQNGDPDSDGLSNFQEQTAGSNPADADSDSDGLPDGDEVQNYATSPVLADTDGDGLLDPFEVGNNGFDPLSAGEQSWDFDVDGLNSLAEQLNRTDPNDADSDGDGYSDGDEVRILLTDPNNASDSGVPVVRNTALAFAVQDGALNSDASLTHTFPVMNDNYAGSQGQLYNLDQEISVETVQGFWDAGWAECKQTRTGSTFYACANYSVTPPDNFCLNGGTINLEAGSVECCNFLGTINTAETYPGCGITGSKAVFSLETVEALQSGNQIPDTIPIPALGPRPTSAPPPVNLNVGAVVTHDLSIFANVTTTVAPDDGGQVDLDYETVATVRSNRATVAAGDTFTLIVDHTVKPAETSMRTYWPSANINVGLDLGITASVDARYAGLKPNPADSSDYQLDVTTNIYNSSVTSNTELFDVRAGAWTGFKMTIMGGADWAPELYRDLEIQWEPLGPGSGITYEYSIPSACPDAKTFTPCNLILKSPVTFDLLGVRLQLPEGNTPVASGFNGGAYALYASSPADILRNDINDKGWITNNAPGRYRPITNISPDNSLFDTFVGDQSTLGGDWFRFEVDLDGWATTASAGAFIAGANFQDPLGALSLEFNVLDSDLVYWAGNEQTLTFRPNLKADLVFSKSVTVVDTGGQAVIVNAGVPYTMDVYASTDFQTRLDVVQPAGGVDVSVTYSFRDNCFENETYGLGTFAWRNALLQLKIQGLIGGALDVAGLPTEFTAFKYTQQFGEPIQSARRGGEHMLGGETSIVGTGGSTVFVPTACQGQPDNVTTQIDFAGATISVMDLDQDDDSDGLSTALENTMCTSATDADSDDDGLFDGVEDANGNGLVDANETSPCIMDTDGDGLTDGEERGLTSPVPDPDNDGPLLGTLLSAFIPSENPTNTTDPVNADSDGDGLNDGDEVNVYGTDPLSGDTDGDGVLDGVDELPLNSQEILDTDRDGIGNNADTDDDNDLVPDLDDAYPLGFSDVPDGYWAFSFVEKLALSGVTKGCGGAAEFCPGSDVTRAQLAVFLERGMNGSGFSPPAATGNVFLDVDAGDFAASFIEQLSADGITAGCGNNNYCPNDQVTRDQMAVFLLRAKYGSSYSPPPATGIFGDVPLNYWAVHWIEQLAAEGITSGCGDGNYCPNDPVTRDQIAVFLVRTFEL